MSTKIKDVRLGDKTSEIENAVWNFSESSYHYVSDVVGEFTFNASNLAHPLKEEIKNKLKSLTNPPFFTF
jgi:hypothetical protein